MSSSRSHRNVIVCRLTMFQRKQLWSSVHIGRSRTILWHRKCDETRAPNFAGKFWSILTVVGMIIGALLTRHFSVQGEVMSANSTSNTVEVWNNLAVKTGAR